MITTLERDSGEITLPVERNMRSPKVIYVVKKIFPEEDEEGNQGKFYQVFLPGDVGYHSLEKRLK
jgi:hypothetical protein